MDFTHVEVSAGSHEAVVDVPEEDFAAFVAGGDTAALGGEVEGGDGGLVFIEGKDKDFFEVVPDLDFSFFSGDGEVLLVGGEFADLRGEGGCGIVGRELRFEAFKFF